MCERGGEGFETLTIADREREVLSDWRAAAFVFGSQALGRASQRTRLAHIFPLRPGNASSDGRDFKVRVRLASLDDGAE